MISLVVIVNTIFSMEEHSPRHGVPARAGGGILFDDGYFMYCEDFDLIRRLHRVSKTLFYPDVTIVHDHAKSSYKNKKMLVAHIRSAIRYFVKFGWFFDKERKEMNQGILEEIASIQR